VDTSPAYSFRSHVVALSRRCGRPAHTPDSHPRAHPPGIDVAGGDGARAHQKRPCMLMGFSALPLCEYAYRCVTPNRVRTTRMTALRDGSGRVRESSRPFRTPPCDSACGLS